MSRRVGVVYDFDEKFGYFLKADIVAALEKLDVEIEPLFYESRYLKRLELVDGLFIPGGLLDLDPRHYGEEKKFEEVKILDARMAFEFKVFEIWLKNKKPLLATCWGFQSLNVFLGGSLYQHLPAQLKSTIGHEQKTPSTSASHGVTLESEAQKIFGYAKIQVNSTHHQGINKLGKNLIIEGRADDGLIECARHDGHPFAWAVQWHPERLVDDKIIPAFVKAFGR